MKCIRFDQEEKYINDFINLSKRLYTKTTNMEDEGVIRSLLTNKHSLSKDFILNKFLIYKNELVVGRFIITEYPRERKVCYIGFFECINDKKVAKFLFDNALDFAKEKNYKKLIGPVDASFWIKYRLKINMFDKLYTSEPYNLDYYYRLFLDNGYKVTDHYTSQIYGSATDLDDEIYKARYEEFVSKGYVIVKPSIKDYDKCIEEVYELITRLYSDFPVFKNLNKTKFLKTFSSYKKIINMDMVRMAYYEGKAVGFYISIPNYYNLVYHLNFLNILKILWLKRYPKEYVMLYMGVDSNHRGLGKAIIYTIIEELKRNKLQSIGALVHDGKITQNYVMEKIQSRYEYVLLERKI